LTGSCELVAGFSCAQAGTAQAAEKAADASKAVRAVKIRILEIPHTAVSADCAEKPMSYTER